MKAALRVLLYPGAQISQLAAAVWAFQNGWQPTSIVPVLNASAMLFVFMMEKILPFHSEWSEPKGDRIVDLIYFGLSALCFQVATLALEGRTAASVWPTQWPLGVQLILALVVSEFGVYWAHRLGHQTSLLWRIHSQHHSALRLYWLNATRQHPIDGLITAFCVLTPLLLSGAPAEAVSLMLVFQASHAFFQHSNIDVRLGPLNGVLSMAEIHRWHHSIHDKVTRANYGQTLLVWDWVFGTFRPLGNGTPPAKTGVPGSPHYPQGLLQQLWFPFSTKTR